MTTNMKTVTILDTRKLRLAQACMAKKDVREYLNYLLLDLETRSITGTDGYRLTRARDMIDVDVPDTGRYLIRFERKIPKSWAFVDLDLESGRATGLDDYHKIKGAMVLEVKTEDEVASHGYPDVDRIIPNHDAHGKAATNKIGFDAKLLGEMAAAAGSHIAKMLMDGKDNSMRIEFDGFDNETLDIVLMPCRI